MGIGISLILIAIGAIITFATNVHASGVNLDVVGWILMGVGLVGFLLSLVMFDSLNRPFTRRRRVYDDDLME